MGRFWTFLTIQYSFETVVDQKKWSKQVLGPKKRGFRPSLRILSAIVKKKWFELFEGKYNERLAKS